MDAYELYMCKEELKEIELNLQNIKKQYERTDRNVVEVVDTFHCHLERISKLSEWQRALIDIEVLKMVELNKGF